MKSDPPTAEPASARFDALPADATRMTIDPEHTTVAAACASARLGEVAGERGRVALATGRPASLLSAYGAIAAALEP